MMKVNELMLNNYIKYTGEDNALCESGYIGKVVEINAIEKDGVLIGIDVGFGCDKYLLAKLDRCEPVPLTEHWLIALGFGQNKRGRYEKEGFELKNKLTYYLLEEWGVEIKYVNQLQNVYLAITGKFLSNA